MYPSSLPPTLCNRNPTCTFASRLLDEVTSQGDRDREDLEGWN